MSDLTSGAKIRLICGFIRTPPRHARPCLALAAFGPAQT